MIEQPVHEVELELPAGTPIEQTQQLVARFDEFIADAPPYVLQGKTPTEQDRLVCETMPASPAHRQPCRRLLPACSSCRHRSGYPLHRR